VKNDAANVLPTRKFTTFIAYEWTAMPMVKIYIEMLFLKGIQAPNPFTAIDSDKARIYGNFLKIVQRWT
jgi:hypothetical protein